MQFKPCTEYIYGAELKKHFNRMPEYEKEMKGGSANLLNIYLRSARFRIPRGKIEIRYDLPITIYFVVNRGIEYDLPHTLGSVIIIPDIYENDKDLSKIIFHELVHIYFRNFGTKYIEKFCADKGLVKIRRERVPNEITNPDTYYETALKYGNGHIFVALVDTGSYLGIRYFEKKYFFTLDRDTRPATKEERQYYDITLPYNQNNHPEEMVAELLSEKLYKHFPVL
jgi:hypothetical protein